MAARPWITAAAVLVATLLFGGGLALRSPQADTGAYLPSESDAARAAEAIDELFGGSSDAVVTTVIFRGDALSTGGLAQMDDLLDRIEAEPSVAETPTTTHAIVAPTSVIGGVLGANGFDSVTQAEINAAIERLRTEPGLARLQTAFLEITGTDSDGALISVASIRLSDTGDDVVRQAQLNIHDLAKESRGPLLVGTVSPALIEEVYQEATGPGFVPLMVLAVLVVSAVMLPFMRSGLDLLLTLMGLGLALVWTLGAEGWLGPRPWVSSVHPTLSAPWRPSFSSAWPWTTSSSRFPATGSTGLVESRSRTLCGAGCGRRSLRWRWRPARPWSACSATSCRPLRPWGISGWSPPWVWGSASS